MKPRRPRARRRRTSDDPDDGDQIGMGDLATEFFADAGEISGTELRRIQHETASGVYASRRGLF